MKKIAALFLFLAFLSCSKKEIQQQQGNIIIQIIVNGQWKISSFNKGNSDVTSNFSPYKFQFKSDLTVDAINNGSVEKTGMWNADASTQTISSNFTNASTPLIWLNGTWIITNTTITSVQAKQTVNGELWTLELNKL